MNNATHKSGWDEAMEGWGDDDDAPSPAAGSGFDDMPSDDLDGPEYDVMKVRQATPQPGNVVFKEACKKCGGSGVYRLPSSHGTRCFACGGAGFHEYKTSPQHRARERAKAAEAKERKAAAEAQARALKAEAWRAAHPAESDWLKANADRSDFARSLTASLLKWGSLTVGPDGQGGQLQAVRTCLAREAERAQQRAAEAAAPKPAIDVDRVRAAFERAMRTGLRYPRLQLDAFTFKPASATGTNPGALYVTRQADGEYLGKVVNGAFHRVRACDAETEAAVISAAADPAGAAVRYGRLTGRCSVCSRPLADPVSVERGIGPICADKYGF